MRIPPQKLVSIIAVFSLSLLFGDEQEQLPPEVLSLREKRATAIQNINEGYYKELKKVLDKYMAAGDLKSANKIDSIMKNLKLDSLVPVEMTESDFVGT